jgi:hypothetical protein
MTEEPLWLEYFDFRFDCRLTSFSHNRPGKFDRASENSRKALPEYAACASKRGACCACRVLGYVLEQAPDSQARSPDV